jgi:hypothetical protein
MDDTAPTRDRILLMGDGRERIILPGSPPPTHAYANLYLACAHPLELCLHKADERTKRASSASSHPYAALYQVCSQQPAMQRYPIRSKESKELIYTVAADEYGKYFYDLSGELKYVFWGPLGATYTGKGAFVMWGSIEGELDGSNEELAKRYGG